MTALPVGAIVFDCADPAPLAEFWCGVTGYEVRSATDRWVLADPEGNEFCICLQE